MVALACGCMLDPLDKDSLPVWSTTLEIPLIQTEITLDTILEDSLIISYPTGENGEMIYFFRKTMEIERVEVGDKLMIDPIEKRVVQYASAVTIDSSTTGFSIAYDEVRLDSVNKQINAQVGLIEMDNVDPAETEPFLLREIMPANLITSIETDLSLADDTAEVVVDTVDLVPQSKPVTFNTINRLAVSSGFLDVTIINNLFIPLGSPINVEVRNSNDTLLFDQTWEVEIPPGESATITQDLSDMVLPGDLIIVVAGTSNGSHGVPVTVDSSDLNSSFITRVEARDLLVKQANAIVPEQTIADVGTILLAPSETVVEEAVLSSGTLNIAITNNLPLTGNVIITIPSLYHEIPESVFQRNFPLQLGSFAVPGSDLAGWTLLMTSDDQELHYNYLIITDDTDSNYVAINQADNTELSLTIDNISLSQIIGQIEQQTINESGDINIGSDSRIQSASISEGQLLIEVMNGIGGEADVQIIVPELIHADNNLDTTLLVVPGSNVYTMELSGFDVIPVSLEDQRLTFVTTTVTRSGSYSYQLLDSIAFDLSASELTFDAVTGYIDQEDNVDESDIDLDSETRVETAVIDSGEVRLTIRNYIGLEADIFIEIAEITREGSSLAASSHVTPSTKPVVRTIDLSGYTLNLPLDNQRIHYTSTLGIPGDELMTLTLDDSIVVDVLIDTLRLATVTGILDTVEVEIDTSVHAFSPLPEEMDGFDFTNVEIAIDFASNLAIPLFLDLTLETGNAAGDRVTSSVSNWNITDSATVLIPRAADLINIRPDRIVTYGSARVGGEGTAGTVSSDQGFAGLLSLRAPLELEIGTGACIITDTELLAEGNASHTVAEEIEAVSIFVQYDNQFEFGVCLSILMDQDLLSFDAGTADVMLDSLVLGPNGSGLDSLVLNDERLGLFNQDSMYVQARLQVLGQVDEFGQSVPSRFLSTDILRLHLYGRLQYLVDGTQLAGSGK